MVLTLRDITEEIKMTARVNGVSGLNASMKKWEGELDKGIVTIVNNAAFKAREQTPAYLTKAIDRPTRFTLRPPFVKKANINNNVISAFIRTLPAQNEYLSILEFGGSIKNVNTPLTRNRDSFGNMRKKFTRPNLEKLLNETITVSRIPRGMRFGNPNGGKKNNKHKSGMSRKQAQKKYGTREVGRYFIGRPQGLRHGNKPQGLWARRQGNRQLELIFEFERTRRYDDNKLNLRDEWRGVAEEDIERGLKEFMFSK